MAIAGLGVSVVMGRGEGGVPMAMVAESVVVGVSGGVWVVVCAPVGVWADVVGRVDRKIAKRAALLWDARAMLPATNAVVKRNRCRGEGSDGKGVGDAQAPSPLRAAVS